MDPAELKTIWAAEEAHIHGWDFSHIQGRFDEERDPPWRYRAVVEEYRRESDMLLDYDTPAAASSRALSATPKAAPPPRRAIRPTSASARRP